MNSELFPKTLEVTAKSFINTDLNGLIVLVITCLGGRFGINCPSAFLKISNSKFSKITRMIYPKNRPNQTCGYWLIKQNQQTLH